MVPSELVRRKIKSDDTNDTLAGKVIKMNKNMTEEEVELMSLNKTKRAKRLAAKST